MTVDIARLRELAESRAAGHKGRYRLVPLNDPTALDTPSKCSCRNCSFARCVLALCDEVERLRAAATRVCAATQDHELRDALLELETALEARNG